MTIFCRLCYIISGIPKYRLRIRKLFKSAKMTKIDRNLIPSILNNRKNGATYQELAIALGCSISGIRKIVKQNDFTMIEEILIASLTPEQRIGVAYHASLVHDDLIKQYLVSYFAYARQISDLQEVSIAVAHKTLESLNAVMVGEFHKKSANSEKRLRIINKTVKSLTKIIDVTARLSEQLNVNKLSDALIDQQTREYNRKASKENSFILETSGKRCEYYSDGCDVINVDEFTKQHSGCMRSFLEGWTEYCKLSYNGEVIGAIVDIKLLNKLQKIGAI